MDETIGVKGGKNDRKRFLLITKKQQLKQDKEEEEEIKRREKKVRKEQFFVFIKAIPIVLVGSTFKTLYDTAHGKKLDKEDENSEWIVKDNTEDFVQKSDKNADNDLDIGSKETIRLKNNPSQKKKYSMDESPVIVQKQDTIPIPKANKKDLDDVDNSISPELLPYSQRKRLEKLKAHKIIDVYESELKDLRYELRKIIADFNVLKDEEEKIISSEEASVILDKLSYVIDRIELLKRRLEIENFQQYDDNYIYTLIEDYLGEFRNGISNDEVVDSPLYILISEKLNELDQEKEKLQIRIKKKKDLLKDREIQFEELKEQYYSVERANQALWEFQNEQDMLLREVAEKIKNAVSVEEKIKVEIEAMNKHSEKLLKLLSFQMLFPGFRGAKKVATSTALYLYFVNQLLNPKTTTKKYRVVNVSDYRGEIEKSMDALDDASYLLSKTSSKIEKIISQVRDMSREYAGFEYECDQLLSNLYRVKGDLEEKEYEMEKMKRQQANLLENNNAKVKRQGEYLM